MRLHISSDLLHHPVVPGVQWVALALTAVDGAAQAGGCAAVQIDADVRGAAPFADEGGRDGVGAAELRGFGAGLRDVCGLIEGFVGGAEDLVDVGVDSERTLGTERGGCVRPRVGASECVVHDDHEVWVGCRGLDGLVGITGKLNRGVEIVTIIGEGLVDKFQADDGVGVLRGSVFLSHGGENGDGLL